MKKLLVAAALAVAAFAYAAAGDLLVISKKEAPADAAAGLSYLGSCASGYLYSGSAAALGRVAPYRTLDRDAAAKDYYVVWAPDFVTLEPAAFAHLGFATRLSADEVLVGVEKGMGGAAAIRSIEYRTELRLLQPVKRVKGWKAAAEPPPTEKDPAIEAAVNTITPEVYGGYIQMLQDFETRYANTAGYNQARDYVREYYAIQGLDTSLFEFRLADIGQAFYPQVGGNMFVDTDVGSCNRSRNQGDSWDTIWPPADSYNPSACWVNSLIGFYKGAETPGAAKVAKTIDGGDTWAVYPCGASMPSSIRAIGFADVNTGWVGGDGGAQLGCVLKTADGGLTWSTQRFLAGGPVEALAFNDANHGWAATAPGPIYYTANSGDSWQAGTGTYMWYCDLEAAGPTTAWAITNFPYALIRTTNGVTWTPFDPGISGGFYAQIEFPDSMHGYAGGNRLIATADGGATWREVTTAPPFDISAMSFADAHHGIIADHSGEHVYRTDDGGLTFVNIKNDMALEAENVIGERRGQLSPEEIVIICGHLDSITDQAITYAPGAEDNATGAACTLASAAALRNLPFKRTVRYVVFGGEEIGLLGSDAYAEYCAQNGEKIVAVLNADMVSYDEENGGRDDLSVAHKDGTDLWLYNYLKGVGALYGNALIYDDFNWSNSDHYSFWHAGYPALGIIEGNTGIGGISGYPYIHTTQDTLDKIQPAFGARFARDFAATLAHLARSEYVGMEDPKPRGTATRPKARAFAVYPNPYHVTSSAEGIRFVGLATPAKVSVYDIAGRKVAAWDVSKNAGDECCWRPAVAGGAPLAPGVYLYTVEGDNQRETGKLALVK